MHNIFSSNCRQTHFIFTSAGKEDVIATAPVECQWSGFMLSMLMFYINKFNIREHGEPIKNAEDIYDSFTSSKELLI